MWHELGRWVRCGIVEHFFGTHFLSRAMAMGSYQPGETVLLCDGCGCIRWIMVPCLN